MIKVYNIGIEQTLARDENHKWYRVTKKSIKVGDIVSEKDCIALSEKLCEIYDRAIDIIAICKANPDIY